MSKKENIDSSLQKNQINHMANERTFLAWIRTAIGIMALGFVLEKFALFMKQLASFFIATKGPSDVMSSSHSQSYSSLFGVILVSLGAIIGLFSFFNYKKTEKQIKKDSYGYNPMLPMILTLAIFIIGIFLVIYLLNT